MPPIYCDRCGGPLTRAEAASTGICGDCRKWLSQDCWICPRCGRACGSIGAKHVCSGPEAGMPEQNPAGFVIPLSETPRWVQDAVYSSARGKNVRPLVHVHPTEKVNIGGTAGEIHFYHNDMTGETKSLKSGWSEDIISGGPAEQALAAGMDAPLRPGQSYLQVVHMGIFGGGDTYGVDWFIHPADAPRVLPPATGELTEDEKILLECTMSLKSSYAGIKDMRGYEAKRKGMVGRPDDVRASLKAKGLMDNRNALTVAGRNAAMQLRGYEEFEENPYPDWDLPEWMKGHSPSQVESLYRSGVLSQRDRDEFMDFWQKDREFMKQPWYKPPSWYKPRFEENAKSTHRYYIVTHQSVPEGFATDDYEEAKRILVEARHSDPNAWLCDNLVFGTWKPTLEQNPNGVLWYPGQIQMAEYSCRICNIAFNKNEFLEHIRLVHPEIYNMIPHENPKRYSQPPPPEFYCEQCGNYKDIPTSFDPALQLYMCDMCRAFTEQNPMHRR